MAASAPEPAVVFTRGGHPESEHRVVWCATGPEGEIIAASAAGAGALGIFPRSATKPFQALPAVRAGVLERFGLETRHLALGCSSHGGSAAHTEIVAEILAACGLSEAQLGCGPLEPRDPAAASGMRDRGEHPSRITHNCSGKHALALGLCIHSGWPIDGYLEFEHLLERAMREAVAEAAHAEPHDMPGGTDGCGMRAFHLPLAGLAAAFGRLASGRLGPDAMQVAAAMREHPVLVAFEGAVDTELMAAEKGLVAKVGAEGVIGIGLADGRGLALKVLDGAMRALDPAAVAATREVLGVAAASPALERLARPDVCNSRGEIVGDGRARL